MHLKTIIPTALILAAILPSVGATPSPQGSACDFYDHQAVIQVAGVIGVGDNEVRSSRPGCGIARSPTEVFLWTAHWNGPAILGAATTVTWTPSSFSGCTLTTPTVVNALFAAASSSGAFATLTMTSNECRGLVTFTITLQVAAVTVYQWTSAIDIHVAVPSQAVYNFLCDSTGTTTNAADPDGSTCNTPDINTAVTGTLTATLAGSLALSGTLGLSQSGSWAFTLSGIPDTQQEIQAIADALAAGLDVTICPETSPCYHVLDGELGVDVLDDTTGDGMLTVPTSIMANSTINQNLTIPDSITVHMCGPLTNVSECEPVLVEDSHPGWNRSLYVFVLLFSAVLIFMGWKRGDRFIRTIGGLLLIVAGTIPMWGLEASKIGLEDVSKEFFAPFLILHLLLGLYIIFHKEEK